MAKPKAASKSASRKKKPAKLAAAPRFSKRSLGVFGVVFALIGAFLLFRALAGTAYVNYYGALTSSNPTAKYSVSTGSGTLDVSFSNNTADVTVTIKGSDGTVVGKLDSTGKKDVKLNANVKADTYSFNLTTKKAFNGKKGYSLKINYPTADTASPTAIITSPLNKESVKGEVTFGATVSDDSGIADVKFYAGDTLLKTDTSSSYSTPWDTTSVADGTVTLKVVATDTSGNTAEATGTVVVDNVETPAESVGSRFPGDPNPKVSKKVYWGSSIHGNGDPVARHEKATGKSLSIRRTFWRWDQANNMNSEMYRTVADDLAKNRLPFISIKPPTWAEVGSGKYDSNLDAILKKLDSYGKPIWFVVNHEPEGGGGENASNAPDDPGGAPAWRKMQTRVRERMNAIGTKNIAFMPVLMSYTWQKSSGRTPDDWWVDGIWDAYCVDHYNQTESKSILKDTWFDFVAWAEKRNIPVCIGEWGTRGTNAAAGEEMREFWEWAFENKKDMLAYTAFDSGLNSKGGAWTLEGEQLKVFQDILKNDTRVQRINDLK